MQPEMLSQKVLSIFNFSLNKLSMFITQIKTFEIVMETILEIKLTSIKYGRGMRI